jgi:NADH-quinone oxidoreductase subunit L
LRNMGDLRHRAPVTFATMFIGTLAITGIFPFAGFFSKDEILWKTWSSESGTFPILWLIGYGTALMTAFYMLRLIYLTFFGQPRMSHEVEHHIHESPKSMTFPLVVLAIGSVFAGWLGVPHSLGGSANFEKFLEPVFARETVVAQEEAKAAPAPLAASEKEAEHTDKTEYLLMILSLAAAGAGWGMAYRSYRNAGKGYLEPIAEKAPPLYKVLYNKWFVDEAYDYAFTGRRKVGDVRLGVMGAGEASSWFDAKIIDGTVNGAGWTTRAVSWLSVWWDKIVIDGICVNGPAYAMLPFAYVSRLFEWGLVQWYALVMVAGLLGFGLYYVWK